MDESDRRAHEQAYARGDKPWPVSIDDWERAAAEVLDRPQFDWIAGGAGEESTVRANRDAFERWRLVPRVLTGNSDRDASVDVLGTRSPAPFLLAPIGGQTVAHPDGELATARAAAKTGVPLVVSTAASYPMEEISKEMGDSARWYQLYWVEDDLAASFVDRALSAGYEAIVLTVDTPMIGWRDRDLRNSYVPFERGHGIGQYTSDPVFRAGLEASPEEDPEAAGQAVVDMFPNFSLTWSHVEQLRKRVDVPLLIKGILSPDDARRARDAGADGVIVSNHGGRQLDGAIGSLDALPSVREAVGSDLTVLIDGGIRRGWDVVKALALGADAVLLGRPYIYGLALAGEAGVEQVITFLMAEIDLALALLGARTPKDVDALMVARA